MFFKSPLALTPVELVAEDASTISRIQHEQLLAVVKFLARGKLKFLLTLSDGARKKVVFNVPGAEITCVQGRFFQPSCM